MGGQTWLAPNLGSSVRHAQVCSRSMTSLRAALRVTTFTVLAIALGACSKGSSGPTGSADVRLGNVPDGVGTLHFDAGTKLVSLEVDAWGFAPSSKHAVHVHPGKCLDAHNAPIITLPEVTADDKGRVKTTVHTDKPVSGGVPKGSRLDIHGQGERPLNCTDLGADPTAAKRLFPQPSEKPFGTAKVTHDSGKLTVAIKLNALHRSTRHAVEIRAGSCKAPGDVRYKLDAIRADGNGALDLSRTVKNPGKVPTGNWALVVYEGRDASSRPLLCGDIGALKE